MDRPNTSENLDDLSVQADSFEVAVSVVEGLYDHFCQHNPLCLGAAQMSTVVGLLRESWDTVLTAGNEQDARQCISERLKLLAIEEIKDARERATEQEAPVEAGGQTGLRPVRDLPE